MVMTTFVSCFNHSDAFVAKLRLSDLEMVCRTAHNPYNEPLPYHRLCPEGLAVLGDTFYVCDMGKRHHSTPWVTPCRMTPYSNCLDFRIRRYWPATMELLWQFL